MSVTRRKFHTIADGKTGLMRCNVCQDTFPLPIGSASFVVTVMRAFEKAHQNCDGEGGRTGTQIILGYRG